MDQTLLSFLTFILIYTSNITAQQVYSGNSVFNCDSKDENGPSTAFLYTCNAKNPSCQAFLIFRSQHPYKSVKDISNLTSSNPIELASINNVSEVTVFPTNYEVIVPVNCSCSGVYYQANSSYIISDISESSDTYYSIANSTYQGLSTCSSLIDQNTYKPTELFSGLELRVPLRCACPTSAQISNGTQYLLTYLVNPDDSDNSLQDISDQFNISIQNLLNSNYFLEEDPIIFPSTTILVPLKTKPSPKVVQVLPIASHSHPSNQNLKKNRYIIIGVVTSSSFLVLFAFIAIVAYHYYKNLDKTKGMKICDLPEELLVEIASADRVLKVFLFEELKAATDNFSPISKLSSSVYRGVLNGEMVVIKKTSADVSKEVNILNKINHCNVIRLYGVCEDNGYIYLVYEFMVNGSLSDWLSKKSSPFVHSWNRRVEIALDIANGIHYLHNFMDPACVHKDINSGNVLLSHVLRAKIANLGLASLAEMKENITSSRVVGTIGYMAPEYLETGSVTSKIDIYAFGVVLLELITGKNVIMVQDGKELLLSEAIITIMEGDNVEEEMIKCMDQSLERNFQMDLVLAIAKLSVACLTRDPASRPNMGEVVSALIRIQMDSFRRESS
ncbi:hypothetical protein GIB67_005442 [Kingdonia uniflora]|uniref:Uncharacterized protein n=1 Tax=Kingdonia uniflora TaxID=39325 RepID=A0A7J7NHU6_9MAGN|nr:hypothetical protein GIB67_005442 [Kingdonia uniflora]